MNPLNGVGVNVAEPKLAARVSPLMIVIIVALHVGGIFLIANLDFWPLRFDASGALVMVRIIPAAPATTEARRKPAPQTKTVSAASATAAPTRP